MYLWKGKFIKNKYKNSPKTNLEFSGHVSLVNRKHLHELVALSKDVHRLLEVSSGKGEIESARVVQNATIGCNTLSANDDAVHLFHLNGHSYVWYDMHCDGVVMLLGHFLQLRGHQVTRSEEN
jgi:hypothetical protein